MKHDITFKSWIDNFFRGVWQVLCRIGRIFNPKYKTPFWRVIWSIITCCIVWFTCIATWEWYNSEYKSPLRFCDRQRLSSQIDFVKPTEEGWAGWTQNLLTCENITKRVDWVAMSPDGDSLTVFGSGGKRGFINRYSGEVAIPAKYRKAWIFSSDVAGVVMTDSVFFIDHRGNPVNDKKWPYNPQSGCYVYHGDYCVMPGKNGKLGLIDKNGNWAVEAQYDRIVAETQNFWRMRKGNSESGLWYAFNNKAEKLTDGYPEIEITDDYGIIATLPNHMLVAFGFDGEKSDAFILHNLESMQYATDKFDENGERVYRDATLCLYRMPDGHEGLCTPSGEMVTEPLYWEVTCVSKDLYLCSIRDTDAAVLINSKGEIIEQKEM